MFAETTPHHRPTQHRTTRSTGTRALAVGAAVAAVAGGIVVAGGASAQAAGAPHAQAARAAAAPAALTPAAACPDVEVVFARGSGELPGLGIVGTPFAGALASDLPGKTVEDYAVNYAADLAQTSAGPGATDMSNHIIAVAAQCSSTKFVIGGYSQGASVTDIAVGIPTILGTGTTIPSALAPRIAAVVTFGNPLLLTGTTPAKASPVYAPKWDDFCALGDPVCGNGINVLAHLSYPTNGDTTSGAQYAAAKVLGAGG